MDSQKFGTFISELRKERGWTQLELAQKLNVTDKAVSKWERGSSHPKSSHPTQGGHMMNHCAKKLLGLAFALALCLAVGGTALAQTPVFADVPDAPPELEMLAYEPNVTTAEDVTTIDALAVGGYKVTIPTTVTVDSTQHTGGLEVNAQLKQYRTLNISIASQND